MPNDGLSAEEIKFFETGDASVLGLPPAEPAAGAAPATASIPEVEAPSPVAASVEAPAPDPSALLAEQMAADRRQLLELQRTIAQLSEKLTTPPAEAEPVPPDPTTQPYEALLHEMAELKKALAAQQQQTQQQTQMTQQQQQFMEFKTQINSAKAEFTKSAPDFDAAYAHLRAQRAADLADVGVPQEQIAQALLQDELAVAQNAVRQGKNPAQVIYNMAKRYGYSPKAVAPTPQEKVAQLAAGQQAAAAPQRGAPVAELPTAASLKDASDADLARVAADDKLWRSVMGGQSDDIFGGR